MWSSISAVRSLRLFLNSNMEMASTARRGAPAQLETALWPLPVGALIGLLFLIALQFTTKWFLFLFLGSLIFAASLAPLDKKAFYLALLVFAISVRVGLNLYFQHSPLQHSTHGFLIQLHYLPLAALYAIWVGRCWLARSLPGISKRGLIPFSAFFAVGVISVLLGGNLLFGAFDLFALLGSCALFVYASSELRSQGDLRIVLTVLVASVAIQGAIAVGQHLTGTTLGLEFFGAYDDPGLKAQTWRGLAERTRVGATIGHPNALALFFDLLLPLGFSLLFGPFQRQTRLLITSAIGFGTLGLVFTLSRGGLVATGLGCLLIFFVWLKQRIGLLRAFCATILPAALILVFVFGTTNLISKRFFRDDYKAAFGRLPLTLVALNMIQHRPLFGVGLNNYNEAAPRHDNTPQRVTSWWNVPVHNQFLFIAAQTGLLGLACYLLFVLAILRSLGSALRSSDPVLAWSGLGVAAGITVFLVHLQIEFDGMAGNSLFWFVSGLAVSLGRLAEPDSKAARTAGNLHGHPIVRRYPSIHPAGS